MSQLLTYKYANITKSSSPIAYKSGGYYQRYLTVNGQDLANTGIDCETCLFYLEVSGGDIKRSEEISNRLNQGLTDINPEMINELSAIIPRGRYFVSLLKIYPRIKKNNEDKEYYKVGSRTFRNVKKIEEYLAPIQKIDALNSDRINEYVASLHAGKMPIALSLSFLDLKRPLNEVYYEETSLFSHFLIDGHHKVHASYLAKKPILLLSFLSIDYSFSKLDDMKRVLNELK